MIDKLRTEKRNEKTKDLDTLSTGEILRIMNEEDRLVPLAVEKALPQIERAVEEAITCIHGGGRMVYVGAGTSGRLGVIDAAECTPTFGVTTEVQALIAGGTPAFLRAVEGAEDSAALGGEDIERLSVGKQDFVVGIAASGRTPYVKGALEKARALGGQTAAISCNSPAEISAYAHIAIEVDCGPEILTGSTRLKSGTAQKLILNMLSTATMVGLGKVYMNLMVDLNCSNGKLVERARSIVREATGTDAETATITLAKAQGNVKEAIVMIMTGHTYPEAQEQLARAGGVVRKVLESRTRPPRPLL